MVEAEPTSHSQRSLLAGVMLVILLACVGAAWWLSQKGNAPASVLDEMRKTTLKKLWGDEPRTDFYLVTDGAGQPAGWWAVSRRPTEDGYAGTTYVREKALAEEAWELADNAQRGQYESAVKVDRGVVRTRIRLRDGVVVVEQGMVLAAQERAPANYIPEGSLDLVLMLVEKRGQGGRFAMLFDSTALAVQQDGRRAVRFTGVSLTPQKGAVKMEVGNLASIYHLNEDGRVEKVEDFGAVKGEAVSLLSVRQLVSPDDIEIKFPDDELLGKLVEEAKRENRPATSRAASQGAD